MKKLYIAPTTQTPEINFDPETHTFIVKGNCITIHPFEFFQPIEKWIQEEIPNTKKHLVFNFDLENWNTASTRIVLGIMGQIEEFGHYSSFDDEDDDLMDVFSDKPTPTNPPISAHNRPD